MKKILTAYTASIYGLLFLAIVLVWIKLSPEAEWIYILLYCACFILSLVLGIVNFAYAMGEARDKTPDCFRTILIFKLIHIPFHIANLFVWMFGVLQTDNLFLWWMGLLAVPVAIVYAYGVLLSTSLYICSHIWGADEAGNRSRYGLISCCNLYSVAIFLTVCAYIWSTKAWVDSSGHPAIRFRSVPFIMFT